MNIGSQQPVCNYYHVSCSQTNRIAVILSRHSYYSYLPVKTMQPSNPTLHASTLGTQKPSNKWHPNSMAMQSCTLCQATWLLARDHCLHPTPIKKKKLVNLLDFSVHAYIVHDSSPWLFNNLFCPPTEAVLRRITGP